MNTHTKTLFTALIAVAGAAAIGLGLATSIHLSTIPAAQASPASPASQIVKLERVVVYGKRAPATVQTAQRIEVLPRVIVEGRRADDSVRLAGAKTCNAETLC